MTASTPIQRHDGRFSVTFDSHLLFGIPMAQAPKFLTFAFMQWVFAMVLSLFIVIALVALTLSITSWGYLLRHPVAAYEEDLGYGFVMMGMLVVCSIIAVPAVGLLAWRVKKIIARKMNEVTEGQ